MIKTPRVIVVGDLHIAQTRNVFVGDEFSQSLTDQFFKFDMDRVIRQQNIQRERNARKGFYDYNLR